MSASPEAETVATILDALTSIQSQLEEFGERSKRIHATQGAILRRLDTIDAGHDRTAALLSLLEVIRAEAVASRAATWDGLSRVAEVAGWAHAAASGNQAPLPTEVVDDPLLERYLLSQPADRQSRERALVDWRRMSQGIDVSDLTAILRRQLAPSPTDTAQDRVLRYQLAAITREELKGRGAAIPPRPESTIAADRTNAAQRARSEELLRTWRAGEESALFAEPELAGAMDIVAAARREGRGMPDMDLAAGLAELHRAIADRLKAGDRPELASDAAGVMQNRSPDRQL